MPKIRSRDKKKTKIIEAICVECANPFYKCPVDIADSIEMIEHRTDSVMNNENKDKLSNLCDKCSGEFIIKLLCEPSITEFWRDFMLSNTTNNTM
jgi:Na+-translocating ferredoxin:NAD+ oxidoreductase RNF subunit RnfB